MTIMGTETGADAAAAAAQQGAARATTSDGPDRANPLDRPRAKLQALRDGLPAVAAATHDRSVALTQLLFGAAVLAVFTTTLIFGPGPGGGQGLFFAGILLTFASCSAAVLVRWSSFSPNWVLLLPVLDILAIGLMRMAQPTLGLGLLWVFPIIWVATLAGMLGVVVGIVLVSSLIAADLLRRGDPITLSTMPALIFLPLVLIFVGVSSHLNAKRTRAQRVLLSKQAELLESALSNARRQEELLAEVLNTVDFGVIRIDKSGQTTVVNEAQARLQFATGGADTVASTTGSITVVAADRVTPVPIGQSPLQRALRGEEFEPTIVWVGRTPSERIALSVTARRLHNADGEYDGSVVVSRDVTAEVTAVLARDDLISSVSHELRTPLTSILGYLELAIDGGGLPPVAESQLQIAYKNANRLLELVADILASSREVAMPMVLNLAHCELLDVVEQSVESLIVRAAERGITIDFTSAEPTTLMADAFRLRQVIDNLISNAIKYNVDGGEVSLGLASDEETVWLIVRDTGIGISDAEQPQLFEKFFRSEAVRNSSVHGSGLGLGISREITRLHGGDLTVQSVEGEGTTVLVTLPKNGGIS